MSDQTPKFTIELIKEEDQKEVYEVLKEFFLKDEPNCKKMGITHCDDAEKYLTKNLGDNCSFKAVDENGKIIGVVSNGIGRKPSPDSPKKSAVELATDDRWRKICMLIDNINEHYDIFQQYPDSETFLDGKAIAVNPNYRGLGIAGELIKRTIQYMKENNIQAMMRTCSSAFSARVMEKLNMKEVYRINYKDFIVNNEQILNPDSPHVACRVFVFDIKNLN
ncbi:arylalkylamine N-acetyltransferase 1-like [Condylostylus longicornis]|uniref:arylalkylamine N-acetyltransferase 1-like n=1 Tax=Condylostylus longicornis TaxID=2530218 RepID=UPI00244DE7B5|nr:arylalkylamine N-acetyltransferase 1-like [Condylostylus longicornis]